MKLVDYSTDSDSSSEASDNSVGSPPPAPKPHHATLPTIPAKKQIIVNLPKPILTEEDTVVKKRARAEGSGGGLFSMLPPPKRLKATISSNGTSKEVVAVVDMESSKAERDELEVAVTRVTTTFTPRSTQTKKKSATKPPSSPSISLFPLGPELTSKPTLAEQSNPSTYQPLIAQLPHDVVSPPTEPEFIPDTSTPPLATTLSTADLDTFAAHILEGRHRKNRTIEIKDHNAAEMYAQNAADKASGALQEEIAPVRAIGSGRHQLTQLLNNVQDQRESLEELFAKGRRIKKESGAKYGW